MRAKSIFISIVSLTVSAFPASAQSEFFTEPYVTNITQNSFDVLFVTNGDYMCHLELAPCDGTAWNKYARDEYWQDFSGRHFMGRYHHIKVDGLQPGTKYRYRIVGTKVTDSSKPYSIKWGQSFSWPKWTKPAACGRTLSSQADSCRFSMVNDMHFNDARLTALMKAMPKDNDFIFLNGDIVSYSTSIDSVLIHTITPLASLTRDYPVFMARGNHESRGAEWWKMLQVFPTRTGEFYYIFRQGPVAFLVLDAGEDKPDKSIEYGGTAAYDKYRKQELEWLKEAVRNEEFVFAPHKVCLMHVPTFNDADAWWSQQWIAENFTPILNEAGVELMLCGHHHRYILSRNGEHNNKYVILANSNTERLDFCATASGISLRCYDAEGNLLHSVDL